MRMETDVRKVGLCDLHAQFDTIGEDIRTAIDTLLDCQSFILGPQVAELEERVADYGGLRHVVGCSSGSVIPNLCICKGVFVTWTSVRVISARPSARHEKHSRRQSTRN